MQELQFWACSDMRGKLVALEGNRDVPFQIERIYYICEVPQGERRGAHAHKTLQQVAICVHGSVRLLFKDGKQTEQICLNSPQQGVLIDCMVWHEMYDFAPDTVLLMLASAPYDESDYIRDYDSFLEYVK